MLLYLGALIVEESHAVSEAITQPSLHLSALRRAPDNPVHRVFFIDKPLIIHLFAIARFRKLTVDYFQT